MHFFLFHWLITARQRSLGSLQKLNKFPDRAVHAVVLRSGRGGGHTASSRSHPLLPPPLAGAPKTTRTTQSRRSQFPVPLVGTGEQQASSARTGTSRPSAPKTRRLQPPVPISVGRAAPAVHSSTTWGSGAGNHRARLRGVLSFRRGALGPPPVPRSPCNRSLKPPAAPAPGGGLTSHPAFSILRSGARLRSFFLRRIFRKQPPAQTPSRPAAPLATLPSPKLHRDLQGRVRRRVPHPTEGTTPLPFPPAPRTYRLAGCASRSRSQCHARPLRAAPPAPGVSSSPGLPLPRGDMARGRWDTSRAGAGRAERGAKAAAGGLPALRGGTCESARWRRAVV